MKKAIVTGAYGYIGSVLCKLLKQHGYYVIGIDNDSNSEIDWVNDGPRTRSCDDYIFDSFASDKAFKVLRQHKDASVFHLAANSLLGPSATYPLSYFENNTANTLRLLQHLAPSHNLISASTAAVYDVTHKIVRETSRLDPPNNYGLSKLWCEQMIDASHEIMRLKAISFRFFNVIGAYDDVGQLPETPHIINQLCDRSMKNETFIINGNDFPTPDGTCIRDYVHVLDICRAMIHADKYLDSVKRPMHDKFNLGTGVGQSVKDIVDIFKDTCNNVRVEVGARRVGDPPFLVADPSKFMKKTDFVYKHSNDLQTMIKSAWEYRNDAMGRERDLRQV